MTSQRRAAIARSRRSFLKSVGAGAAALPFYRLLESSAVLAADEQPLRFVAFYHPHGNSAPLFAKQASDTETSFDLKFADSVLTPFDDAATYGTSFKNKVVLIDGIDLAAGVEKNTNGHDAACILFTGSAPNGGKTANESLDQYLAVTQNLGQKTRIASMVLGVGNRGTESGKNISYGKAGAPVPKTVDPIETYKTLFGDFVAPGGGNDAAALAEAAARLARGKSVLDNMRAEIKRLESRLAGVEKLKMQQFTTAVGELEKQLGGANSGMTAAPSAGCSKPAMPDKTLFPKLEVYNGGEPYLDKIADTQFDMLAYAIACDITRFGSVFIHLTEEVHNNVAHQYQSGNRDSVLKLGNEQRFYYAKVARFLQKLQQFGVIDSTLVYATSDMGDPNLHSVRGLPTVLAGGLNGRIKMGRRLSVKSSNNKLLVSIAKAFDTNTSSFGSLTNAADAMGVIPGL